MALPCTISELTGSTGLVWSIPPPTRTAYTSIPRVCTQRIATTVTSEGLYVVSPARGSALPKEFLLSSILLLILDRIVLASFPPIIPMLPLGGVESTFGCFLRTTDTPMALMYSARTQLDIPITLRLSGSSLSAPPASLLVRLDL